MIDEMARKLATDLSTRRSFDAARFRGRPPSSSNDPYSRPARVRRRPAQGYRGRHSACFRHVSLRVYQELDRKAEIALKHLCKRVEDAVAAGHENGVTVLYEEGAKSADDKVMTTAALILFAFGRYRHDEPLIVRARLAHGASGSLRAGTQRRFSRRRGGAEAGRLQSPVQRALRLATEDSVIGGNRSNAGTGSFSWSAPRTATRRLFGAGLRLACRVMRAEISCSAQGARCLGMNSQRSNPESRWRISGLADSRARRTSDLPSECHGATAGFRSRQIQRRLR